jgi:hypothetical protein
VHREEASAVGPGQNAANFMSRLVAPNTLMLGGDDAVVTAACVMAKELASRKRLGGRAAQVRNGFISRETAQPVPPLVHLLRASSKDAVHLRVLLSLLWVAGGGDGVDPRSGEEVAPPYSASFYLDEMARLVGLPAHDEQSVGRSRRRIATTLGRLVSDGFARDLRGGLGGPRSIQLLREDLRTRPGARGRRVTPTYSPPGREDPVTGKTEGGYVRLPATFWTKGWIAALPGSATAIFLILKYLDESLSSKDSGGLFLSSSLREERFGISEDLYYKGTTILVAYGLLTADVRQVRKPFTRSRRMTRTTFGVNLDRLDSTP